MPSLVMLELPPSMMSRYLSFSLSRVVALITPTVDLVIDVILGAHANTFIDQAHHSIFYLIPDVYMLFAQGAHGFDEAT